MTFSLIGRCARTGQFGAAVTTSSIAVGSRVPFCVPGVGAVLTQHRTDPRLGPRGLALLRSGCSAEQALAALVASTPDHQWRQLAVLDAAGRTAAMRDAFLAAKAEPLAERLMRGLEAGLAAGGEPQPVVSAVLVVVEREDFPLVDLRVDLHPTAVAELRRVWDAYRPSVEEFVVRAVNPDAAK